MKKTLSLMLVLCTMFSLLTLPANATEISTIGELAQNETAIGTYVYEDMSITIAAGEPEYTDELVARSPVRIGAAYPVSFYDENMNLLFTQRFIFNIDGEAGSYEFSPTVEWEFYTSYAASGVLFGGMTETRLSDTMARHAFTWYYNDAKFRTTVTFSLNPNTGSLSLYSLDNTRVY